MKKTEGAKHTPGPWDVEALVTKTVIVKWGAFDDADGSAPREVIAEVYNSSGVNDPNARLIAAAPELLEAAKWSAKYLQERDPIHTKAEEAECEWCIVRVKLEAAIAKAEGR